MEKQLRWACKLGGMGSLGISKAGQILLARLMESPMWHKLAGSVEEGVRKGTMASSHLDERYFSLSLYATSAFQIATLALELQGSESK